MLSHADLQAYCGGKAGSEASFPFGPQAEVFKVMGKMFALLPTQDSFAEGETPTISLKCDPTLAEILRENHAAVVAGYHLNKRHWNTVTVDGSIPDEDILDMIEQSYALVVKGLKKADRERLQKLAVDA